MRYSLFAVAFLVAAVSIPASSQVADSIPKKQSRYFFSVRSSMLLCGDCDLDGNIVGQLSTVHGLRLNRTFDIALGTGITSVESAWVMPLFGNLRMNMYGKKRKKNKLF